MSRTGKNEPRGNVLHSRPRFGSGAGTRGGADGARAGAGDRRAAACAAFTLIEVLISVVILATGIVVILQAFQTSAAALGASRDTLTATMLLRRKTDALRLAAAEGPGTDPTGTGTFAPPFEHFRWEIEREHVSAAAGPRTELDRLTVRVWRGDDASPVTVETYMLSPKTVPDDDNALVY